MSETVTNNMNCCKANYNNCIIANLLLSITVNAFRKFIRSFISRTQAVHGAVYGD